MSPSIAHAGFWCAVLVAAGEVSAQPVPRGHVQFRVIERTGQTTASAADNVLDLAVQMMSPEYSVRDFGFNIRIAGEPESSGTLQRSAISEVDGTYSTSLAVNSTLGRGGLASQYTYFAGINPAFNGSINQSSSLYSNGPDQEILLVAGVAAGSGLLRTPGMDTDGDGNPDTWSGNGGGTIPPVSTVVSLDTALAGPYFGFGQFIDVYHFRYTLSTMTPRVLRFELASVVADTGVDVQYVDGLWGVRTSYVDPAGQGNADRSWLPLEISVIPAPPVAMLVLAGLGLGAGVRRRMV
jgi:hypothetical protein